VAAGGIVGSLARFGFTDLVGPETGFPWTVFTINVVGCSLLAALPALGSVRRTPWLGVLLGTGVLGGFTTMSAASAETVVLFETGRSGVALAYIGGTLIAAILAVWTVDRLSTPEDRAQAEATGVDS